MQSWGREAHWDQRGSHPMPTKSGIAGMLACAMGVERNDERTGEIARSFRMGVRADRPGTVLEDFHTVTGSPLLTAERKKRTSGNTIITRREYLEDASFLVVLEADHDQLEMFRSALEKPVWPVYLGRRSCVPSRPVLEKLTDEYESVEDALRRYPLAARRSSRPAQCEYDTAGEWALTRNDQPLSASARTFSVRRLARMEVEYVPDAP